MLSSSVGSEFGNSFNSKTSSQSVTSGDDSVADPLELVRSLISMGVSPDAAAGVAVAYYEERKGNSESVSAATSDVAVSRVSGSAKRERRWAERMAVLPYSAGQCYLHVVRWGRRVHYLDKLKQNPTFQAFVAMLEPGDLDVSVAKEMSMFRVRDIVVSGTRVVYHIATVCDDGDRVGTVYDVVAGFLRCYPMVNSVYKCDTRGVDVPMVGVVGYNFGDIDMGQPVLRPPLRVGFEEAPRVQPISIHHPSDTVVNREHSEQFVQLLQASSRNFSQPGSCGVSQSDVDATVRSDPEFADGDVPARVGSVGDASSWAVDRQSTLDSSALCAAAYTFEAGDVDAGLPVYVLTDPKVNDRPRWRVENEILECGYQGDAIHPEVLRTNLLVVASRGATVLFGNHVVYVHTPSVFLLARGAEFQVFSSLKTGSFFSLCVKDARFEFLRNRLCLGCIDSGLVIFDAEEHVYLEVGDSTLRDGDHVLQSRDVQALTPGNPEAVCCIVRSGALEFSGVALYSGNEVTLVRASYETGYSLWPQEHGVRITVESLRLAVD